MFDSYSARHEHEDLEETRHDEIESLYGQGSVVVASVKCAGTAIAVSRPRVTHASYLRADSRTTITQ